jgi:hypothetical protein
MIQADRVEFGRALQELISCYPTFRPSKDSLKKLAGAYWKGLCYFPTPVVMEALGKASDPENFPDRFPSRGQLVMLVRKLRVHPGEKESLTPRGEISDLEKARMVADRDRVPRDPPDQALYVAEAKAEAEKVARTWEVEDQNSGRVPWCDTPLEIGKGRLQQLAVLMSPFGDKEL